MNDSGYVSPPPSSAPVKRACTRGSPTARLAPQPLETVPAAPEFWSGGGPLYSTPRDYLSFLQMLLHGGSINGRAAAQAGDRRADAAATHRQYPVRRAEDRDASAAQTTSISSPARRSAGHSATC